MNTPRNSHRQGFNSLDLLVMLMAVAVVVMVVLPMLFKSRRTTSRFGCVNNLKQIGLSFRLWSGDNGDKFPSQVSTNAGGTMELVTGGTVFPHFLVMSNELGTPKILICREDAKRWATNNFAALRDTNLSYFVVPEADETIPDLWLSGDRDLATNNVVLKPGLFTMTTNRMKMNWSSKIHQDAGNIVLADGSVQQVNNWKLYKFATNAWAAHYLATSNTTFRIAIP